MVMQSKWWGVAMVVIAVLAVAYGMIFATEYHPENLRDPVPRDAPIPASDRSGYTGDSVILGRAIGVLVNNRIAVHCDDDLLYAGMADAPGHDVWIYGAYCDPWENPEPWNYQYDELLGPAIITLAHEARHTRGYFNEARTECWALQKTDDLARILGYSEERILSIWHYAYLDHKELIKDAPQYGDRRCRPNRAWDLTPGDGRWP